MPTISMFYGIVIYLYFFDDERHKLPHVHARYQGQEASFAIGDGTVLSGEIPRSKTRLVQAGLKSTEMRFLRIGNWLSMASRLSRSTR